MTDAKHSPVASSDLSRLTLPVSSEKKTSRVRLRLPMRTLLLVVASLWVSTTLLAVNFHLASSSSSDSFFESASNFASTSSEVENDKIDDAGGDGDASTSFVPPFDNDDSGSGASTSMDIMVAIHVAVPPPSSPFDQYRAEKAIFVLQQFCKIHGDCDVIVDQYTNNTNKNSSSTGFVVEKKNDALFPPSPSPTADENDNLFFFDLFRIQSLERFLLGQQRADTTNSSPSPSSSPNPPPHHAYDWVVSIEAGTLITGASYSVRQVIADVEAEWLAARRHHRHATTSRLARIAHNNHHTTRDVNVSNPKEDNDHHHHHVVEENELGNDDGNLPPMPHVVVNEGGASGGGAAVVVIRLGDGGGVLFVKEWLRRATAMMIDANASHDHHHKHENQNENFHETQSEKEDLEEVTKIGKKETTTTTRRVVYSLADASLADWFKPIVGGEGRIHGSNRIGILSGGGDGDDTVSPRVDNKNKNNTFEKEKGSQDSPIILKFEAQNKTDSANTYILLFTHTMKMMNNKSSSSSRDHLLSPHSPSTPQITRLLASNWNNVEKIHNIMRNNNDDDDDALSSSVVRRKKKEKKGRRKKGASFYCWATRFHPINCSIAKNNDDDVSRIRFRFDNNDDDDRDDDDDCGLQFTNAYRASNRAEEKALQQQQQKAAMMKIIKMKRKMMKKKKKKKKEGNFSSLHLTDASRIRDVSAQVGAVDDEIWSGGDGGAARRSRQRGQRGAKRKTFALLSLSVGADPRAPTGVNPSSSARRLMMRQHPLSSTLKKSYCAQADSDCDFILEDDSILRGGGRHGAWAKVPAVQKWLLHYEWIVWMDTDVLIMNMTYRFADILTTVGATNETHFILARDSNGINSGVFFMRNTPWSFDFLHRVWDREYDKKCKQPPAWWEQRIMMCILDPETSQRTIKVDARHTLIWSNNQRLFNAYFHEGPPKRHYKQGDFVVHFPHCKANKACLPMFDVHYRRSVKSNGLELTAQNFTKFTGFVARG